ncbi:hypothetical protein SteCoe_21372 [Stentor coeruleus]|uniref:Calmodulin n=1 Tax=Stentor coeruleus TaxID=5963 RepID=A0A1R2BPJ4_9CILI|nr:hypothetical protein SteCoe_21372 [Stentor coeruleus]
MSIILSKELLSELNQCRTNPRRYSAKLTNILKFYKGNSYEKPGKNPIITKEGSSNVVSLIKYLKTIRPSPPLKWSPALYEVAKDIVEDHGPQGLINPTTNKDELMEKINYYCKCSGHIGENIDYSNDTPEDIVMSLLIDDGCYARYKRLNIMKKDHRFIGAAIGFHAIYEHMCSMIFAETIIDDNETEGISNLTLDLEEIKDMRVRGNEPKSEVSKTLDFSQAEIFINKSEIDDNSYQESLYRKNNLIIKGSTEENKGKNFIDPETQQKSLFEQSDDSEWILKDFHKELALVIEEPSYFPHDNSLKLEYSNEISNLSVFQKDLTKAVNSINMQAIPEETDIISLSLSQTEIIDETPEPAIKSMPKTKPPLNPKSKEKKDEFVVSNFERSELSKDAVVEIKELFDLYDTSGSGFLDANALKAMKGTVVGREWVRSVQMIMNIEPEAAGTLNFENFVDLYVEKLGNSVSKQESLSLQKNVMSKNSTSKTYSQVKKFDPTLYMRPEFSRKDVLDIKQAFDMFDRDNTGTISPSDMKLYLKKQGLESENPTVFHMINNLKTDDLEKVNFGEFLDLLASEGVDYNSVEEIQKLFSIFDVDKTGFIELSNLRRIVKEVGEALEEADIIELLRKSDLDGDGRVNFQDLYNIMNKRIF